MRQSIFVSIILLCLVSFGLYASDSGVKLAVDLKTTGEKAKQQSLPLMMFFAAEDCGYCERLEADYLTGMANSAEYRGKVIIRKVVIDSYDELMDFNGKTIEASDFSDKFDIQVTPTVLMVDHKGDRVSKRIIGYNSSGFFGEELDNIIESASEGIK